MHTVCHFEIPSNDIALSADFYKKVFNWKTERINEDYLLIFCDEKNTGGIYKTSEIKPSQLMIYIEVSDIEKTLDCVVENGGSEIEPKRSIGDYGFVGAFADPCGARIELWSEK